MPQPLLSLTDVTNLKVWVLAPQIESDDPNISYYYDFAQSIAEYTKTFNELNIEWQWQPVTMQNFSSIIDIIVEEKISNQYLPVVFNICDGDEINGAPGISVVKYLQEKGLIYTGSDEYFYNITTSKIPMKQAFDEAMVPTAAWEIIDNKEKNLEGIFNRLGKPLIIKPAVSGGSMGVGIQNVVKEEKQLAIQVEKMFDGYRGWNLASDGLIAESFINGPEFTTLIVGSYDNPEHAVIYQPVERVFHESLPDN
jgi:D-alanine-D-alanine ligase